MMRWLLCALLCWPLLAFPGEMPAQGSVEVLFTPWDDAEGALIRQLDSARQSVHVQAYLLTSRNITRAFLRAHARGVQVAVLADRDMATNSDRSLLPELQAAGIPVWLETRYAAAHNKIILIDATTDHPVIMTGSYNFTYSAQARNAENLLILRDQAGLARAYLANWQRHRDEAALWQGAATR